jgi:hypothetical protein
MTSAGNAKAAPTRLAQASASPSRPRTTGSPRKGSWVNTQSGRPALPPASVDREVEPGGDVAEPLEPRQARHQRQALPDVVHRARAPHVPSERVVQVVDLVPIVVGGEQAAHAVRPFAPGPHRPAAPAEAMDAWDAVERRLAREADDLGHEAAVVCTGRRHRHAPHPVVGRLVEPVEAEAEPGRGGREGALVPVGHPAEVPVPGPHEGVQAHHHAGRLVQPPQVAQHGLRPRVAALRQIAQAVHHVVDAEVEAGRRHRRHPTAAAPSSPTPREASTP